MDELERLKSEINLTEYAASRGYQLDRRESSRNSVVMGHPVSDDKIIVSRADHGGHWIYFSVRDARDSGTIIDFVQHRDRCSLADARRELEAWLGVDRPRVAPTSYRASVSPREGGRDAAQFAYDSAWLVGDSPYLRSRGIRPATLTAPRLLGTFRADSRARVLFPHHDDAGFAGFESKGYGWTSFARGGVKALWSSNTLPADTRLVLVESAIDALSHYQLHPDARTRYASTAGSIGEPSTPGDRGNARESARGIYCHAGLRSRRRRRGARPADPRAGPGALREGHQPDRQGLERLPEGSRASIHRRNLPEIPHVALSVDGRLGWRAPPMRRRAFECIAITAAAGAVVLLAAILGHRTIWNLSSSVPRGLYAVMPDEPCRRGSLVSFSPPPGAAAIIYSRDYLPKGAGLIKRIVGVAGDRVCIRADGVFVNGVRLGDVARSDSRGRPLAPYPFCGGVPQGQAFVATTAPLSYDSRYFGPVPIASLIVVVPVWTY